MRKLVRRVAVIAAVAASLVVSVPAPVQGARPVFVIDAVTVTATGGTWPHCSQDVTVAYRAGHRAREVRVYGWQALCPYQYEFVLFDVPATAGSGVATARVQIDYSLNDTWGWTAYLLDPRGRALTPYLETSRYTFTPGTCPTSGVLATYP